MVFSFVVSLVIVAVVAVALRRSASRTASSGSDYLCPVCQTAPWLDAHKCPACGACPACGTPSPLPNVHETWNGSPPDSHGSSACTKHHGVAIGQRLEQLDPFQHATNEEMRASFRRLSEDLRERPVGERQSAALAAFFHTASMPDVTTADILEAARTTVGIFAG